MLPVIKQMLQIIANIVIPKWMETCSKHFLWGYTCGGLYKQHQQRFVEWSDIHSHDSQVAVRSSATARAWAVARSCAGGAAGRRIGARTTELRTRPAKRQDRPIEGPTVQGWPSRAPGVVRVEEGGYCIYMYNAKAKVT